MFCSVNLASRHPAALPLGHPAIVFVRTLFALGHDPAPFPAGLIHADSQRRFIANLMIADVVAILAKLEAELLAVVRMLQILRKSLTEAYVASSMPMNMICCECGWPLALKLSMAGT